MARSHSDSNSERTAPDMDPMHTAKQASTRSDVVRVAVEPKNRTQTWSIPEECPHCHGLHAEPDNAITINSELIIVFVRCCECTHMWTLQRRGPLVRRSPDRRHPQPDARRTTSQSAPKP
jgi:hypothetical protein